MSVPTGERKQGKLQVLNAARILLNYTYDRITDTKRFPKSERWILPKLIFEEVRAAVGKISEANDLKVDDAEEGRDRLKLQREAISHLKQAEELIDLAHQKGKISGHCADVWIGHAEETLALLRGWRKADKQTYKKLHEK